MRWPRTSGCERSGKRPARCRSRTRLFTIKVYVEPLHDLLEAKPYIGPRLINLIESATPAVREYKGMTDYAEPLLTWLRANVSTPITHQG
ncbi:MAG: hypothetical protein R2843_01985 [Thermomicrobiales bacterium]